MISQAFGRSLAWVVGVDTYDGDIPTLQTAVADAQAVGKLLAEAQGFEVIERLNGAATAEALLHDLEVGLREQLGPEDRLLIYFAGHGVAQDGDDGPEGFLVPADATTDARDGLLAMSRVSKALKALPCRHLMVVLDCCFAGAFRWSSTRSVLDLPNGPLHNQRFKRFVDHPAAQVLVSAGEAQKAADVLKGLRIGRRPTSGEHSPFAHALLEGLRGAADAPGPDGRRDGVITASELYAFVREVVEPSSMTLPGGQSQTPSLWPLPHHGRGEFLFRNPDVEPRLLDDPRLDPAQSPWRGLNPYQVEHQAQYFGREAQVQALTQALDDGAPVLALTGESGVGKTSLLAAGLVAALRAAPEPWTVPDPVRPGAAPADRILPALAAAQAAGPRAAVAIDSVGELLTEDSPAAERGRVIQALAEAAAAAAEGGPRLLLTLREDLAPAFADTPLGPWLAAARQPVEPMSREALRRVIHGPAEARVLFFEPIELVDRLIDDSAGRLPLLSFALAELYRQGVSRDAASRALTAADLDAIGGVTGALRQRAEALFAELGPAERESLRHLMVRLVRLDANGASRRRPVPPTELVRAAPEEHARVQALIDRLVDAHLVARDGRGQLEAAHDALLTDWDRLDGWVDAAAPTLPVHRRLTAAAATWRADEQDRSLLWPDHRDRPAAEALPAASLSTDETAFLEASASWAAQRRRRRWITTAAVVSLFVVGGLTAWFLINRAQLETEREEARAAQAEALKDKAEAAEAKAAADKRLAEQEAKEAQAQKDQAEAARALTQRGREVSEQVLAAYQTLDGQDPVALARAIRAVGALAESDPELMPASSDAVLRYWAPALTPPNSEARRALRPNLLQRGETAELLTTDGRRIPVSGVPEAWYALPGGQWLAWESGGGLKLTVAHAQTGEVRQTIDLGQYPIRRALQFAAPGVVLFEMAGMPFPEYLTLRVLDVARGHTDKVVGRVRMAIEAPWRDCVSNLAGKSLTFGADGKLQPAAPARSAVRLSWCIRHVLPRRPLMPWALAPVEPAWRRWSPSPYAEPGDRRLTNGGHPLTRRAEVLRQRVPDVGLGNQGCREAPGCGLVHGWSLKASQSFPTAAGTLVVAQYFCGDWARHHEDRLGGCLVTGGQPRQFNTLAEPGLAAVHLAGPDLVFEQTRARRTDTLAPVPMSPVPAEPVQSARRVPGTDTVVLLIDGRVWRYDLTGSGSDRRLEAGWQGPWTKVLAIAAIDNQRLALQTPAELVITDLEGQPLWRRPAPGGPAVTRDGAGLAANPQPGVVVARWGDRVRLRALGSGTPLSPLEAVPGLSAHTPTALRVEDDGAVVIDAELLRVRRAPPLADRQAALARLRAVTPDSPWRAPSDHVPCPPDSTERDGACWSRDDVPGDAPAELGAHLPTACHQGPQDGSLAGLLAAWARRIGETCKPGAQNSLCGRMDVLDADSAFRDSPPGAHARAWTALGLVRRAALRPGRLGAVMRRAAVQATAPWLARCHRDDLKHALPIARQALDRLRRGEPRGDNRSQHAREFFLRRKADGVSLAEQRALLSLVEDAFKEAP